MAITVKEVLDRKLFNGMKAVAGLAGLQAVITWVNIMEIPDSPDTINRGEFLITTGYGLENEEKYHNLIQRLKARGVPAVAVQTGYYVSAIPDYLIRSADEYEMPLLEMPANYSFSNILHILLDAIHNSSETWPQFGFDYHILQSKLRTRITSSALVEDMKQQPAYLFLITTAGSNDLERLETAQGLDHIQSFLSSYARNLVCETVDSHGLAIVMTFENPQKASALTYDLQIQLTFLSEQEGTNYYAAYDSFLRLEGLLSSYEHCIECLTLLGKISAKRGVCSFEDYNFIRMFGFYYNTDHSCYFENTSLQTLLAKDRRDHTNLVQTLRVYLAENCNITHAAERLFIHRHTMMNRIQAITDLSGVNLDDYYQRIFLSIALLMHDYFAL